MPANIHDEPITAADMKLQPTIDRPNPALKGPVLLATDGRSKNGAAVVGARLIAERLGRALEIVTVLEPEIIYGATLGGVPVYLPEVEDARRQRRLDDVQSYVARHSPSGTASPPVHMRSGPIAQEIAAIARQRNATLIVVGAAPHRRLNHMVAGERAVQVLRSTTVPVLSIPPGFAALPRTVVVAIDFSPASIRAAQAALLLVAPGGTLTLVHVLSPLFADAPIRDLAGRDPSNSVQMLFGRVREVLRPFLPADVTLETRITTDAHTNGILETAADVDADLVVVGTHGPRFLERLFIGSVASSVMHTAPQAVLAAPPPLPAEAMELWLRITGTAQSDRPREWGFALDEFTRRNKGYSAAIEVDDPDIGSQMLGRGTLLGVTYDGKDRRVEIMVGDSQRVRSHLMHSIPNVDSIAVTADERAGREALEVRHGKGQTLVLVGPGDG
jgi:nucleotide-binding universal stress UspA family protein